MEGLSERDRAVLNTIFDPLQSLGLTDFSGDAIRDPEEESEVLDDNVLEIVKRAIACAEEKNFERSFELFEEALDKAPRSASILNDRAQALRLAGRDKEALDDLHCAVEISGGKGKVGIQALCQRGALYRCMKEEDKAREDFQLAAKGGSNFARSQLVALNPYAAMCNAMLREITLHSNHR
ncbi:hypothetical protein KM043_015171 [Ampulex compressa]|nr:hypothetical protein KM043_015171 [Ampulex compressa]